MGKENAPRTEIGLWIDHKEAVIVALSDSGIRTSHIASGAAHPKTRRRPKAVTSEDGQDRKSENALNAFYDQVVAAVRHAESVQIFGPGEAKGELEKRFDRAGLTELVVYVEAADKMSDREIAARVRKHFQV